MRIAIAIAVAALAIHGEARQTFRTGVEAVRVDVLVLDGNRPVAGLTAADFELRDAGVVQAIDSVAFEDVPLSIMLALDASGSVHGQPLEDLKQAALAVTDLMKPDDRAALLTFSAEVAVPADWTGDQAKLAQAIATTQATGGTALHDAVHAALTLTDPRPGRSLLLLFSDGDDTASWLPGQTVIDLARRSEAVIYSVGLGGPALNKPGYLVDYRSGLQPDVPNVATSALMRSLLVELAETSGGKYITAGRSDQLRDTFVRILTEFRTRYLITYTPRGVDARGWHPLEVTLKGKKGKVTARRGYQR